MIRPLIIEDIEACADILQRLPDWFGMPETNAAYIESLYRVPTFVAEVDGEVIGFLALETTADSSVEITVMGVTPERHRAGIGRALVAASEEWCREHRIRWLHVKTRGPSTYDDDYERTRRFYLALGFEPLYESLTEWGSANAALVLVKHLTC